MSTRNHYHQEFIRVLEGNSLTDDPLAEWKYAGGNMGRHARYYNMLFPDEDFLPEQSTCICGHNIVENCYIQNTISKDILVVGNCCIMRYLPERAQGRRCPRCNIRHSNRKDAWCNECRGGILNFGKHRGRTYRWTLENDPNYCDWALGIIIHPSYQLSVFRDWLDRQ